MTIEQLVETVDGMDPTIPEEVRMHLIDDGQPPEAPEQSLEEAPVVPDPVLLTLVEAWATRTPVILEYQDAGGKITHRVVFIVAPPTEYILAWCELRKDWRQFKTASVKFAVLRPGYKMPARLAVAVPSRTYAPGRVFVAPATTATQKTGWPQWVTAEAVPGLEQAGWARVQ